MKKDCEVVEGNTRCKRCLKGKKGCKFSSVVEEEVEETAAVSKSPVASIKKFLASPIRSMRKRKEADLSPESQKEKIATSSAAVRSRKGSSSPERGGEVSSIISMPPPSNRTGASMPPSSIISSRSAASSSSRLYFPSDDYRVQLLQTALRESQEDLSLAQDRFASRESVYLDRIAALESQLGKGGSSSKGRK